MIFKIITRFNTCFLNQKVYFEFDFFEFFESRVCTYRYGLLNSLFQVVSSLPTLKSISDGWLVHGNVHSIKLVLHREFGKIQIEISWSEHHCSPCICLMFELFGQYELFARNKLFDFVCCSMDPDSSLSSCSPSLWTDIRYRYRSYWAWI